MIPPCRLRRSSVSRRQRLLVLSRQLQPAQVASRCNLHRWHVRSHHNHREVPETWRSHRLRWTPLIAFGSLRTPRRRPRCSQGLAGIGSVQGAEAAGGGLLLHDVTIRNPPKHRVQLRVLGFREASLHTNDGAKRLTVMRDSGARAAGVWAHGGGAAPQAVGHANRQCLAAGVQRHRCPLGRHARPRLHPCTGCNVRAAGRQCRNNCGWRAAPLAMLQGCASRVRAARMRRCDRSRCGRLVER